MSESPLSEASPSSLEEIFSSSPLERKPEEWAAIVAELQKQRAQWAKDEAAGKKTASTKKAAAPKAKKQEISLDDLDFE